jgi:hypothetical protein
VGSTGATASAFVMGQNISSNYTSTFGTKSLTQAVTETDLILDKLILFMGTPVTSSQTQAPTISSLVSETNEALANTYLDSNNLTLSNDVKLSIRSFYNHWLTGA